MPTPSKSTVIPALRYRNAPAAIDWLCQVLGFERHAVHEGPGGTVGHAELTLNGGMIMLGSAKDDEFATVSNLRTNWTAWKPAASTSLFPTPTPSTPVP